MRFCLETDRYGFLSRLRSKVAAFGNVPAMASQLRLNFRLLRLRHVRMLRRLQRLSQVIQFRNRVSVILFLRPSLRQGLFQIFDTILFARKLAF